MGVQSGEARVTLRARDCRVAAIPPELECFASLAREFPCIDVETAIPAEPGLVVAAARWRDPTFDFWAFDRAVDRAAETNVLTIVVVGPAAELPGAALELLTRCQRVLRRRNQASATEEFERVLERHRALHDLSLPLVRADYDHALDTWQWLLRLAPEASLAVQLAALFHDVERLRSEPERRIEQHAADYQRFKDRHAARGAELAAAVLREVGLSDEVVREATRLIATHERRTGDRELALLNDADALSFFSLNSAGFADYYGAEHTQKKIAYSLNRLSPHARRQLAHMRLRPGVRAMIGRALA